MKRSALLILLLVSSMIALSVVPATVSAKPQAERTDWTSPITHLTIYSGNGTYENYSYPKEEVDGNTTSPPITGLYGNFNVISGGGINFFICNSTEGENWIKDNYSMPSSGVYMLRLDNSSYKWAFAIPSNDTSWSIIFNNTHSSPVSIDATFGQHDTPPSITLIGATDNETVSGSVTLEFYATSSNFNISWTSITITPFATYTPITKVFPGNFTYVWDTTKYSGGWYSIEVAAEDQTSLITAGVIKVFVDNTAPADLTPFLVVIGIFAVIVLIEGFIMPYNEKRKRKRMRSRYRNK